MFCDIFSSHKTYSDGGAKPSPGRFGINLPSSSKSVEVVGNTTSSNMTNPEKYLTQDVWEKIRESYFYSQDYDVFRKLNVGPFLSGLLDTYPPPKTMIPSK